MGCIQKVVSTFSRRQKVVLSFGLLLLLSLQKYYSGITITWMNNNNNNNSNESIKDVDYTVETLKRNNTVMTSSSTSINQTTTTASKEDGVLVTSKTEPSFQIWLFHPEDDIISQKILSHGVYEPEETFFVHSIFSDSSGGWAVDIGANIGFHTLHMAALGAKVIAFEPSPDTATLLKRSIHANGFHPTTNTGYVHVIEAAAAATPGTGHLVRHPKSPGMTILQREKDSSKLPFGLDNIIATNIPLIQPSTVISDIIFQNNTNKQQQKLKLLKVDAEGHELYAFRGVNLTMYPFEYITFELFPELLIQAGGTDPLDLLYYINSNDYYCATDPTSITSSKPSNQNIILADTNQINHWYQTKILPEYKKDQNLHLNLFCKKHITK